MTNPLDRCLENLLEKEHVDSDGAKLSLVINDNDNVTIGIVNMKFYEGCEFVLKPNKKGIDTAYDVIHALSSWLSYVERKKREKRDTNKTNATGVDVDVG